LSGSAHRNSASRGTGKGGGKGGGHGGSVIIEMYPLGRIVKVSAIDPESLLEVSIQGPATAGESTLKQAAVQKLRYVLAKQRAKAEPPRR